MIQIGDRMPHKVRFWETKDGVTRSTTEVLPCKVVYIHPSRRWCTLLVELPCGHSFRSSEFIKTT